jgi:hypothetical protein
MKKIRRILHPELHRRGAVVQMEVEGQLCPLRIRKLTRTVAAEYRLSLEVVREDSDGNCAPVQILEQIPRFVAVFPVNADVGEIAH